MNIFIESLHLCYRKKNIFKKLNLEINKPGFYSIIGKNGSGKSTLLKAIKGLIKPKDGNLIINNDNKILDKKYISYVSTNQPVFDNLTVLENLLLYSNDNEKIASLIDLFDLNGLKNHLAKHCSSGEIQRINIIRVILEDNPIILLDEVTNHLDDQLASKALNYFQKLAENKIIIFASNYEKEVKKYSTAIYKIIDYDLVIISDDNDNHSSFSYEQTIYNDNKILKKALVWRGHYFFIPFITVILAFLITISHLLFIKTERIYKLYQDNSSNGKYSLIDYHNHIYQYNDDNYKIDESVIEELKKNNEKFKNAYILCDSTIMSAETGSTTDVFLIDNDLGNSIVVGDDNISKFGSYFKLIITEWNILGYLWQNDPFDDVIITSSKTLYGIYPRSFVALSQDNFDKIIYDYYFKYFNSVFSIIDCVDYYEDIELISGRMPEDLNEVIIKDKKTDFGSDFLYNATSKTIYDFNRNVTYNVVGYYSDIEINDDIRTESELHLEKLILCNELTAKDIFDTDFILNNLNFRVVNSLYIDSKDITESDLSILFENNLFLINDLWKSSHQLYESFISIKQISKIITIVLLVTLLVVTSLYVLIFSVEIKEKEKQIKYSKISSLMVKKIIAIDYVIALIFIVFMSGLIYMIANIIIAKQINNSIDIDMSLPLDLYYWSIGMLYVFVLFIIHSLIIKRRFL